MSRPDRSITPEQSRTFREVAGFAFVSGTGLALDYAVYTVLHLAGMPVTLANIISASGAVTFVYVASLRHVFEEPELGRTHPFPRYVGYQAIAVPAASIAVGLVEHALDANFLIAKTLVVPWSFLANFTFMRWLLRPLSRHNATDQ